MPDTMLAVVATPDEIDGIRSALERHGLRVLAMDRDRLCEGIGRGDLPAAVITDTILAGDEWKSIAQALRRQPAWCDFPIVLVANKGVLDGNRTMIEQFGNVGLVERPVDAAMLANVARAALRARERQRQMERLLSDLEAQETQLEAQIESRTADLLTANAQLRAEIQERRKVEARLRDSEELHRFTVELSGQFAWTASPEGRILSASPRFVQVTGLAPDVSPHEGFVSVLHPDDVNRVFGEWGQMRSRNSGAVVEFRLRMADGTYRMYEARAVPRLDKDGRLIRWYGITEDVQDKKEAEAARRIAEDRYQLALMASNDAIWDYEIGAGVIHWGDTAGEALGYEAMLGTTPASWWEDRIHPDDRDQALSTLADASERGGKRWSANYRFRTGSGEYRALFDRGFIMRDADGKAVRIVGAITDVSEQQRAEEEIHRMQAELIHVSRLSAMGTMASTLAHELNQPLTAVTSYLRGARHILDVGDTARMGQVCEALKLAESGALRAGQIVRRLRDLVAKGTAAMRAEDLPKLIEDAGSIAFLDAHLLGVVRHLDLDPEAHWVDVDRIQIQQVLINLVRNSIQAMQTGAQRDITIRTRRIAPDQVEIAVIDTGTGIPPEVRQALFTPFQGTKAGGLGIGLSISRTIVEAHGGKIWADDRPGGGAIFCFTLPVSAEPGATPGRA